MNQRVVIIGGGAAGFFAAITIAETNPDLQVTILEKSNKVLQKVKISGGGRCNVTHACFDPKDLVEFYPRGKRELLGPFHQFMTGDVMQWFEERGVALKIEADNRVFPVSNSSQTVIDCLLQSAKQGGVEVQLNQHVKHISKIENQFKISTDSQEFLTDKLLIATGSSPKFWRLLAQLGHTVIPPVPSLFTFNTKDLRILDIPGISVPDATVNLVDSPYEARGPLLITHWGISGPSVLKLSAFGALFLAEKNYQYDVHVNWISKSKEEVLKLLKSAKATYAKRTVVQKNVFQGIPRRLWENLVSAAQINPKQNWADLSNQQLEDLASQLTNTIFKAKGKSTFKEEFVTAGGVDLKEINFKRFESKLHKNLFMAGEVLNIDAVTGGFNFQNAWTGAYVAGKAIALQ